MGSLFRGWPKDRIAQIYLDDSEPDQAVCSNSRHLEIEDLRMPRWLRRRIARIGRGFLLLVGMGEEDAADDGAALESMAAKALNLRGP